MRPSRAKKKKPSRALARPALARPGDPYVNHKGEVTPPDDNPFGNVDPLNLPAKDFRGSKKKSISELPAPPKVLNGIAAAIVYTALGVQDSDIESALGIQRGDLKRIRDHEAYTVAFNLVVSEFISANSTLLTSRIGAYAHTALSQVHKISMNGEKESNRLKASDSILDRAGIRPQDNVARINMGKNDLRILVVDGNREVSVEIGNGDDEGNAG